MGNTALGSTFGKKAAAISLEVCLSPVQAEPPRGRNGLPCDLVARIGTLGDQAAGREVPWEEAVIIQLPSEQSAVLLSLYAREIGMADPAQAEEQLLTQVCLPYRGPGCLAELGVRPGGLSVPLQLLLTPGEQRSGKENIEELAAALRAAREGARADRPCLSLSVRELAESRGALADQQVLDDAAWSLPQARRQLITLELQNAALRQQRQRLVPEGGEAPAEESNVHMSHTRQLQLIREENEQIRFETARMHQKLDRAKAVLADTAAQVQREASPQGLDWVKTLSVMQHELEHCKERERKIRANYEERVAGLQGQLQQALQPPPRAAPALAEVTFDPRSQENIEMVEHEVMTMQARIKEAALRRDDLLWQMNEAKRKAEIARQQAHVPFTGPLTHVEEGPEIRRLREQSRNNEAELEALRQELALQHERLQGSERQQGLRVSVSQLYEELDERHRAREDERVRSESEIRELKTERDALRDRLDDATSELQRSRSQAEAYKAMREQAESFRPCAAELDSLRVANAKREKDLEHFRECEEERKLRITELEREQEVLVEQTSLKAAPRAEGSTEQYTTILRAKEQELGRALDFLKASCQEHEDEVERIGRAVADARERSRRGVWYG